jgi:regulator of RNase E activity RraA
VVVPIETEEEVLKKAKEKLFADQESEEKISGNPKVDRSYLDSNLSK